MCLITFGQRHKIVLLIALATWIHLRKLSERFTLRKTSASLTLKIKLAFLIRPLNWLPIRMATSGRQHPMLCTRCITS